MFFISMIYGKKNCIIRLKLTILLPQTGIHENQGIVREIKNGQRNQGKIWKFCKFLENKNSWI